MKRIAYTLLAVIVAFMAATLPASAQSTEIRQVSGFHSIASGGSLSVHVKIDGTESLKISTRADVIKLIETVVEDGTLKIKFKDNLKPGEGNTDGPINIFVTAKSLSSIIKEGSGSVDVDGTLMGREVNIILNGSGNVRASVKSQNLNVTMSGAGSVKLNGTADIAKITKNGAGEMNGRDIKTKDALVVMTGAGNVYLSADKSVSAHIAGSGSVIYSGNAVVKDSKISGSGAVSKVK